MQWLIILRATPSAAGPFFFVPFGFAGSRFWGHLGASVPPFWHSGSHFGISGAPWEAILVPPEHLGKPCWHLGTTLEDHGSSMMHTKLQITGFWSILEWFLDLFMSAFQAQNTLKIVLYLSLFLGCLVIDFWLDFSTFGTSKLLFSHWRYCKNRLFVEIVLREFRNGFLVFLWGLGSLNKLENGMIFDEIPNLTFWIWGCRFPGFLGPLKT